MRSRVIVWTLVSLLVFSGSSASAQNKQPATETGLASQPRAPVNQLHELASDVADTRAAVTRIEEQGRSNDSQLRRQGTEIGARLDALEHRPDAQDKVLNAYSAVGGVDASRFGAIATLLAIIVTGVVIFFTIRTSATAVAEAKLETEKLIGGYKSDLKELIQTAREHEKEIQNTHDHSKLAAELGIAEIESLRLEALEKSRGITLLFDEAESRQALQPGGELARQPDPAQQQALADAASSAAAQQASAQGFDSWYLQGLAAHDRGEFRAALDAYLKAEDLAPDIVSRARLLNSRARALWYLGQQDDADSIIQRVLDSYGGSAHENAELQLREQVAKALYSSGVTHATHDRLDEALAAYGEVQRRFGAAKELPLREQVVKALVNKGAVLQKLHRHTEALAVIDEVLRLAGANPELSLRLPVAMAYGNKGLALAKLNRPGDAIAAYDEVQKLFGTDTELAVRETVAGTLINKALLLKSLSSLDQAAAALDEVQRLFGTATESTLRELIAKAKRVKERLSKS